MLASDLALAKNLSRPGPGHFGRSGALPAPLPTTCPLRTWCLAYAGGHAAAGLDFVGATLIPAVNGAVLTWSLGALAPGDSGPIDLTVQVTARCEIPSGCGTPPSLPRRSRARRLPRLPPRSGPDRAAHRRRGTRPHRRRARSRPRRSDPVYRSGPEQWRGVTERLRRTVTMPQGGSYSRSSVTGVDSVRRSGQPASPLLGRPARPGASRTIRFGVALTSSSKAIVQALAQATARRRPPAPPRSRRSPGCRSAARGPWKPALSLVRSG